MHAHLVDNPKRILKRQKDIIISPYTLYTVSIYKCSCGCNGYYVTVDKGDLGYTKRLQNIEYNNPLETFIKFEKLVKKCKEDKYSHLPSWHS